MTDEELHKLRVRALARRFSKYVRANASYAHKVPDEIIDDPLLNKIEDVELFKTYLTMFGLKQRPDWRWEVQ